MKNKQLLNLLFALSLSFGLTAITQTRAFCQQSENSATNGLQAGFDYLNQIRSNQKSGTINPIDVANAKAVASEKKRDGSLDLSWISRGPDNFSGAVSVLVFDKKDDSKKTIYAGSLMGGVWKSITNGVIWNKILTEDNVPLNVSCMVQAPNGDIYVGTGSNAHNKELSLFGGHIGKGIYKISDNNTLKQISSTDPGTHSNFDSEWAFVNDICVSENSTIFAATEKGLKYSTDNGETWNIAGTNDKAELSGIATNVKLSKDNEVVAVVDNILYIAGQNSTVFEPKTNNVQIINPALIGRMKIAIAPSNANFIYIVASNKDGSLNGIFATENKGETWNLIAPSGSSFFNLFGSNNCGNYSMSIAVSAVNPKRILVGGYEVWEGEKILETGFYNWEKRIHATETTGSYIHGIYPISEGRAEYKKLFLANDIGVVLMEKHAYEDGLYVYKNLNRDMINSECYSVDADILNKPLCGTQRNGVLYINGSGTTEKAAFKALLPQSNIGGTVITSTIMPQAFFYSTQKAAMYRTADRGENVANNFFSISLSTNDEKMFRIPFKLWENYNDQNSIDSVWFVAKDTSYLAGTEVVCISHNNKFPFKHTLLSNLNKHDSVKVKDVVATRFFIAINKGIYMSREALLFSKDPHWNQIAKYASEDTPSYITCSNDLKYVYVGMINGKVFRLSNVHQALYDSLANYNSNSCVIKSDLVAKFENRYITSISIDPQNNDNVIVTLGNYGNDDYVFVSNNATSDNVTFNSAQGDLPKMPVYSSVFESISSNRLIIGTDFGIFSTPTKSGSFKWYAENLNIEQYPIMDLVQKDVLRPWIDGEVNMTNHGCIYAATFGGGVYECRNFVKFEPNMPINTATTTNLNIYPNPARNFINIDWIEDKYENILSVDILSVTGVKQLSRAINVNNQNAQYTIDNINLAPGVYMVRANNGKVVKTAKLIIVK